jgi:PAS domain S-box-containing protein
MNPKIGTLRLLLFLAVTYALVGAVGLTLAIPPGYASPVFPAAGLALGCVLWFGRRAVPGIWLGSSVMNLAHTATYSGLTSGSIFVAAVIATGVTLQAWVGCRLVTRYVPTWKTLEREQDVFRFLFWGGGLACLLSAFFGITGLYLTGILTRTELLYNYWNWYVGDTMGVLVFAPLTLCLLNREDSLWGERRRRIVAPLLITLAMSLLAFYGAAHWEKSGQQNRLQTDGKTIAKLISDRLIAHREVLVSLHNFIEVTPDFTFRQFQQFTRITLKDKPDIFALGFNDLVTREERPAFERKMGKLSPLGPFQITQRDSQKRLVRAGDRPEYVAVRYIVPLAENQPAVGFDINSEPIRRAAIQRARASKTIAVTAPIKLVQEKKQRIGVLELMPQEDAPTAGGNPRLLGFAVAVIKVDELIDIAIRDQLPPGLRLQVIDRHAAKDQNVVYLSASGTSVDSSSRTASWNTGLQMGDRDWELKVIPSSEYWQQQRPWVAWSVGVAGLLFATLLQTLLLGMTGRTAVFQCQNEALKASEKRYQRLFNDSPLPMWLYETDTMRFLMVNDRAVAHYGWSQESFLMMNRLDLILPDNRPAVLHGEGCIEGRHIRQNGSVIDVLVHSSPAEYGGQEVRLEVIQDITQDKTNQAELIRKDQALMQSEKMASIGQLAAGVAHEINNPLGFISSNLRTLVEYFDQLLTYDRLRQDVDNRELSAQGRETVAAAREELEIDAIMMDGGDLINESLEGSQRVTKIVKDLKNYSRVDAPEWEEISLSSCLESALNICFNELKYVAVIRKEYEPLPDICGHHGQLNQVFLNLLVNAGQAIDPPGEIVLRCWHDDAFVYASVSDTGKGIPEDVRKRIFDPFFTTKEVGKGTGLGLSISFEIIKKHQGDILVESSVGTGTTFTVKLPLTPLEPA